MKPNEAKTLVDNTFNDAYDEGRFRYFIRNLFTDLEEKSDRWAGSYVPEAFRAYVSQYGRVGKFTDPEGYTVDVLAVKLKSASQLERARSAQRNFIARYLNGGRGGQLRDAALVAFYADDADDWRFSLVRMDYTIDPEAGKVRKELTPARRYSFLVGPNERTHTARQQLSKVLVGSAKTTLGDLEDAFNIETVTKEFFEKYKGLFLDLKEALDTLADKNASIKQEFETKEIDPANFAKRLLGQVVFLYFLQKKGWLGVERGAVWGTGPKDFLQQLLEGNIIDYRNFFDDILEPLFYDALANLAKEHDDNFVPHFKRRVPFLNGGLFEPIGGYDWVNVDIPLSNDLFSDIFGVFDLYNFTVREDEPLDKEVAVDPEMLGKVFENLLEVTDRKSKGAFYTPREIVHYMCQESLINYLDTTLNTVKRPLQKQAPTQDDLFGRPKTRQEPLYEEVYEERTPRQDIEAFIRLGDIAQEHDATTTQKGRETKDYRFKIPESIRQRAKDIDDALTNIKICDPAIGSGAFPVGMMNEIVRARSALNAYLVGESRSAYAFKRHAIQESIYGVDVDASAVDIAKLRLWLSLVVDEDDFGTIKPLPNLDYKIKVGNALLGVESPLFDPELLEALEQKKSAFVKITSYARKKELARQIESLFSQIVKGDNAFDFEVYFSEVFKGDVKSEQTGFDIVIANPPYIGEKGNKELFYPVKERKLEPYYMGKMDYFYFFFHLALNIAKAKGQICFITTNYFITATGGEVLRKDFRKRAVIRRLVNFNELKIFNSARGQHNMITMLTKQHDPDAQAITAITPRTGLATDTLIRAILMGEDEGTQYFAQSQCELYDGPKAYIRLETSLSSEEDSVHSLLDRIKRKALTLGSVCSIKQGIVSGADKVTDRHLRKYDIQAKKGEGIFTLTDKELQDLCLNDHERSLAKPFYKNSQIQRYYIRPSKAKYVLYVDKSTNLKVYPTIEKHLCKFKPILEDKRETRQGRLPWYSLHWSRDRDLLESIKIVWPRRAKANHFALEGGKHFEQSDCMFLTLKEEWKDIWGLKFLLAVLNSRLYYVWFYFRGKRKGEMFELYGAPISEAPIIRVSNNEQASIVELVEIMLSLHEQKVAAKDQGERARLEREIAATDKQIDALVYELYDLTEEETAVVEESVAR